MLSIPVIKNAKSSGLTDGVLRIHITTPVAFDFIVSISSPEKLITFPNVCPLVTCCNKSTSGNKYPFFFVSIDLSTSPEPIK